MMPIYWLQRRNLIKQYLKMHYRQQPITVIRLDRSRMFPGILRNIEECPELKTMWERYRKQFTYAADIEYEQIINVLKTLLGINAIAKREAPVTDK